MKLKLNWPYLIFCIVAWAILMCGIGGSITLQALHASHRGLPIPGDWSWPAIYAVDIVCAAAFLFFPYKIYVDLNTIITDEFIQQPNLFGLTRIDWTDVVKVKKERFGIQVQSKKNKIIVSPFAYAKPDEVISKVVEMAKQFSISTE